MPIRPAHLRVFLLFALVWAQGAFATTLHRITYTDDPMLKVDRALLERAYGGKVYAIPPDANPPSAPERLEGIVMHVDAANDPEWVMGDRNPLLDYRAIRAQISREFPELKDIDEKWDEYRFLMRMAPAIAPPEMHLGSEFMSDKVSSADQDALEPAMRALLAKHEVKDDALLESLLRLEGFRSRINAKMGKSLLKVRDYNHSEGRLPKTTENLPELYLNYFLHTKPKVDEIEREAEGTSVDVHDQVLELPFVEGRVLHVLLTEPKRTIVQKMVKIQTEARVHVVEGEILEGATFLRFYPLGKYLKQSEIKAIHEALRKDFLPAVKARFGKFSCTPDLIIEKETGKVRILDMNGSLESGYFYPEEDLFTTNLLAERLLGERTPLLEEFEEIKNALNLRERRDRIQAFRKTYKPFIKDYTENAFWDRILPLYMADLTRNPRAETWNEVLHELSLSGLNVSAIFHQFLSEVHDTFPDLRLSADNAAHWATFLNKLNDGTLTTVDGNGRLIATEVKEAHLGLWKGFLPGQLEDFYLPMASHHPFPQLRKVRNFHGQVLAPH